MEVSEFADLHLDHFDTTRAEAVWLRIGDQRDPREAPFYYQAIRTAAVEAYSVPFSQLAPWLGPMPSTPILIFSIGRCGSTLFSQIAKVAGVATWSEPDTFTNLASDKNLRQDPDLRLRLARVALNDLAWKAQAEGGQRYFAVKLRSRVTHLCETLSSLNPDSKSLFIVREPVGWAKSFGQHFGADPRVLANNLSRMVSDIRKAKAGGLGIRVIDYADMKDRPGELCLELSGLSGKPFDQDELDAVMASDPQAGTTISREAGKELPPDFVPTFLKCLEERDPTLLQTPPSMWI
ncbi:hypothetical protein RGQ15_21230 [Paracoccus sp. MBLB3053]|uniref:Sulfotransferase family protein n=1 Tax=Paracoccus aurantius TaxID=3073814 RepID=A0ABU2HYE1_9RHOB|nr:hypothetical protein [Paracoccus sp. MBLB3053]MDS9470078.1 hypothetical protein [Paracoccus sp. MBLB3053]